MTRTTQRVARELRDRLAEILEARVSDPRLEGLSVVEVRPSPDLSFARVFYRTWQDPEEADAAIQHAKPFIRRCLGDGLSLRRVPELDFRLDPSAEAGARVEEVLKEIAAERERRSEGTSLADAGVEDPEAGGEK